MNSMTQGSIDKIFKHAGKLALLIEKVSDAHNIMWDYEHQSGEMDDTEVKLTELAIEVANLYSSTFCNDCGDIFKQFYNRQLDENLTKQYSQSTKLGPTGSSECPDCGNSSQNGIPYGTPYLRRCANCKSIFRAHSCCIQSKISGEEHV